jgi:phenylalanyl-tRNA synthetase beta chain
VHVPALDFAPAPAPEGVIVLERAKALLVDRGYQEVVTYSFVDADYIEGLTPGASASVLANPISADMSVMRTSIWAGLLKTATYNLNRQQTRLRLFESGLVFNNVNGELVQTPMLGGLLYGPAEAEAWANNKSRAIDFFDLKGDVEALLGMTAVDLQFVPSLNPALHPGQGADVLMAGVKVGCLGALHPSLQSKFGFAKTVYLFALDITAALTRKLPRFSEISRFPEVRRDLAVIVDENAPTASILKIVRETAGEWLTQLVLFDVYQGPNLEPGRKSVAFGLILQNPSRTLKDEEVTAVVNQVVNVLQQEFNVTLRE